MVVLVTLPDPLKSFQHNKMIRKKNEMIGFGHFKITFTTSFDCSEKDGAD